MRDASKNLARSLVSRFFALIPSTSRMWSNCFRTCETPRTATNKVSQKLTTREILLTPLLLGRGSIGAAVKSKIISTYILFPLALGFIYGQVIVANPEVGHKRAYGKLRSLVPVRSSANLT